MASPISRLYDFQPGTKIFSSQIDSEFNQLVTASNTVLSELNAYKAFLLTNVGASNVGASTIPGVSGSHVQTVLLSLKGLIDACITTASANASLSLKEDKTVTAKHVKTVTFNAPDGKFTFTHQDNSTTVIDTALEKVVTNFTYNASTQALDLTMLDGSVVSAPLSDFITETEFQDSDFLDFSVSSHKVTATIKPGSITETQLNSTIISTIHDYSDSSAASAVLSANSATTSTTKAGEAALSATSSANSASAANTSASTATSAKDVSVAARDAAVSARDIATAASTAAGNSAASAATNATNAANSSTTAGTAATNAANSVAGFSAIVTAANSNIDTKTTTFDGKVVTANTTIDGKVTTATTKAAEAVTSAATASSAASTAVSNATATTTKAAEATTAAATATAAITGIAADANKAKSYAVGNTGTRAGEDTDNAQYWSTVAREIATGDVPTRTEAQGYVATHTEVIGDGSILGHLKLSSSVTTTSGPTGGIAATPTAVRDAYNLAASKTSKSSTSTATLSAASWVGEVAPYTQTYSNGAITATSPIELLPASDITLEQLTALQAANIQGGTQSAGSIVLRAFGTKPTINLPIQLIVRGDL